MLSELEAIKTLLLREWDPIGISALDGPKDEYDTYATRVLEMLREGADAVAVARYLNWVVTSRMSLRGNLEWDRAIAAKAVAIHNRSLTS